MAVLHGVLVTSALCFIYSHLNRHLCAALPQQETIVSRSSPSPGGCLMPDTPTNGEYTSPLCKSGPTHAGCDNVPGTPVPGGWTIEYRCSKGYEISAENSNKFNVCDNGTWNNPIECVRTCPKLSSSTVVVTCKYKERSVKCDKPMKPNTTAHFECKPNYKASTQLGYSRILCTSSSWWSQPLPECFSECGLSNKDADPLILDGRLTDKGDYPWLAGLYRQNNTLLWEYFCSGTLISPKFVLTAAHCVTTPEAQLKSKESIQVGLGKYFKDYYKKENSAVIYTVEEIIIPEKYSGTYLTFALDIALLDLSFTAPVNNYIMPACVDWQKQSVFKRNTIPEEGHVSGWGHTDTGRDSDKVHTTKLKYIEQTKCVKDIKEVYKRYVHVDKFCTTVAGNGTGGQVEQGDSGGGMTVIVEGVHYVVGVVSVRVNSDSPFSVFTDVKEHLNWVETEKMRLEELHRTALNTEEKEQEEVVTQAPQKKNPVKEENPKGIQENCTQKSGATWPCKLMKDCEKAVDDFKNGIVPDICGLEGRYPKVCCQPYEESQYFKSKEKCKEYAKSVYSRSGNGSPIDTCALIEPLIINGINTEPREYPHMALIGFGDENLISWQCGGSLVSEKYILSAAACSNRGTHGLAKWARLGDYDIESSQDEQAGFAKAELYRIIERINHPQFSKSATSNMPINDIALFKLDRNVEFNEFIRPACLHTELQFTKPYVIATGWGRTTWGGKSSKILQKANLTITSRKDCNKEYFDAFGRNMSAEFTAPVFCAGNVESEKDTCKGDAGGPLQLRLNHPYCMYSIVGITSFGRICGGRYPSVYTRVSYFVPWIETILWP